MKKLLALIVISLALANTGLASDASLEARFARHLAMRDRTIEWAKKEHPLLGRMDQIEPDPVVTLKLGVEQ